MTIIIGTDPTKALDKITALERVIDNALGRSGLSKTKLTNIKRVVADANERCIQQISRDVVIESPAWSYYLLSNWEYFPGRKPFVQSVPSPTRTEGRFKGAQDPNWLSESATLVGEEPIYIYNDAEYAGLVASGDVELKSAPSDWYLSIEQSHASGRYFRRALQEVLGGSVL